jgi:hypothetical protein
MVSALVAAAIRVANLPPAPLLVNRRSAFRPRRFDPHQGRVVRSGHGSAGYGFRDSAMSTRAAVKLLLLSLVVFAVAFAIRRTFLWDVAPVAWDQPPQSLSALAMAFLLRSIENLSGAVAVIALAFALGRTLLLRHHRRALKN